MEPETPYLHGGMRLFGRRDPKASTLLSVLLPILFLVLLCACGPATPPPGGPGGDDDDDGGNGEPPLVGDVRLVETASGFDFPVAMTHAGDGRLFVVERAGRISIVENGAALPEPFLDISDEVKSDEGEQGMLGLAFPPDYASSGAFYVYFTNTDGRGVLARFHRSNEDPDLAEPTSEILITLDEASTHHNGGQLAFGPDRNLYWAVGDAGLYEPAQDPTSLRGKILRLDVSPTTGYDIPEGNPFAENGGAPEVWALGLRNPWRFSFDVEGDRIYIADVGEDEQEEVNVQPIGQGGVNYGWPNMEGENCFRPPTDCGAGEFTAPTFTYDHDENRRSITGGYVYRGPAAPDLEGSYIFADFMTSRLYTASEAEDWTIRRLFDDGEGLRTATFGTGADGRLYVADFSDGTIYEITQEMPGNTAAE